MTYVYINTNLNNSQYMNMCVLVVIMYINMQNLKDYQDGFIPLMIFMISVLLFAIIFVFLRVIKST